MRLADSTVKVTRSIPLRQFYERVECEKERKQPYLDELPLGGLGPAAHDAVAEGEAGGGDGEGAAGGTWLLVGGAGC